MPYKDADAGTRKSRHGQVRNRSMSVNSFCSFQNLFNEYILAVTKRDPKKYFTLQWFSYLSIIYSLFMWKTENKHEEESLNCFLIQQTTDKREKSQEKWQTNPVPQYYTKLKYWIVRHTLLSQLNKPLLFVFWFTTLTSN